MAELHWFPVYLDKWMSSAAINAMLPEQEGAFWRLLICAWGNGEAEPSLPADDTALSQMSRLGRRWAKLGPLVRSQFVERDGRLYNAKLSTVWQEQTKKHASAAARGAVGGKAKRQPKRSPAQAQLPGSSPLATTEKEIEKEERLVAPTEPTSTLPAVALGAEAPRSAVELPVDRDARSAGWSSVRDTLRAIPGLRARPA